MLEILGAELLASIAKMLKKNVSRTIGEDEGSLDEFRRGSPLL